MRDEGGQAGDRLEADSLGSGLLIGGQQGPSKKASGSGQKPGLPCLDFPISTASIYTF